MIGRGLNEAKTGLGISSFNLETHVGTRDGDQGSRITLLYNIQ